MTYRIDKDIPPPAQSRNGRAMKYPWDRMEVGDSFFALSKSVSLLTSAAQWAARQPGPRRTFTALKTVEDGIAGVRIWRRT